MAIGLYMRNIERRHNTKNPCVRIDRDYSSWFLSVNFTPFKDSYLLSLQMFSPSSNVGHLLYTRLTNCRKYSCQFLISPFKSRISLCKKSKFVHIMQWTEIYINTWATTKNRTIQACE